MSQKEVWPHRYVGGACLPLLLVPTGSENSLPLSAKCKIVSMGVFIIDNIIDNTHWYEAHYSLCTNILFVKLSYMYMYTARFHVGYLFPISGKCC